MKIDKYKMLYSGTDGGDTCHRMYTLFLRTELCRKLNIPIPLWKSKIATPHRTQFLLEIDKGIYHRTAVDTEWGYDPRNFSRDQTVPVLCYQAVVANSHWRKIYWKKRLLLLFIACLKRGMFAQNKYPNWCFPDKFDCKEKFPDWITPDLWCVFLRGLLGRGSYFFTWFMDIFILISIIFKVFVPSTNDGKLSKKDSYKDVDDDNAINLLLLTQYLFPTPLSFLSRVIFKKFRKKNIGCDLFQTKDPIMGALLQYHTTQGNREIIEVTIPLLKRF